MKIWNGATFTREHPMNWLAFCSGQETSMEVKQKVTCNFSYILYFIWYVLGLGLHLKALAEKLPSWHDLHEPNRTLTSLSEYEHLHQIFRLCSVHVLRNIKQAAVPEPVKKKMRSLICIEHEDFEGCLQDIACEGGKVGASKSKFYLEQVNCRWLLLQIGCEIKSIASSHSMEFVAIKASYHSLYGRLVTPQPTLLRLSMRMPTLRGLHVHWSVAWRKGSISTRWNCNL